MTASPPSPGFPARFHVAVDVVALTISPHDYLQIAVVQRKDPISCIRGDDGRVTEVPRRTHDFALPGGHVDWTEESLEEAACRKLREKTGIHVVPKDLVQVGAYGDKSRDPRPGRTVSIAFVAFNRGFGDPTAGSEATHARFIDVIELLARPNRLEFDHRTIIMDAITRVRDRMERYPEALKFCNDVFTLGDIRRIYEVVFADVYGRDFDVESIVEQYRLRRDVWNLLNEDRSLASSIGLPVDTVLSSGGTSDPQARARAETALFSQSRRMKRLDIEARLNDSSRSSGDVRDAGWGDRPRRRRGTSTTAKTYDEVVRLKLDPANFQRKVEDFLEREDTDSTPTSSETSPSERSVPGRPRSKYRKRDGVEWFNPPVIVIERPPKKKPRESGPSRKATGRGASQSDTD